MIGVVMAVVLQFYTEVTGKSLRHRIGVKWCKIQTKNSRFYVGAIYYPPDPEYLESEFLDHIPANCEQILLTDPNAKLIIAGDINQLKIRDFCNQFNLEQLVKKSTRGHRILDVFLTNNPHMWNQPTVFKGLVRSDHLAVMVTPRIQGLLLNQEISLMFNESFPRIKVKTSSRDPPYMSPLVKYLCNIRNKQINRGANTDLQERIN